MIKKTTGSLAVIGKPVTVQSTWAVTAPFQRQASLMYGDKLNRIKPHINFKGSAWDRLLLLDYARQHNIHARPTSEGRPSETTNRFPKPWPVRRNFTRIRRGLHLTATSKREIRQMLTRSSRDQDALKFAPGPTDKKELKELYQKEKTSLATILPWESHRIRSRR